MGEKPTAEDEAARHESSMNAIGNIRGREADPSTPAAMPGDPVPDVDVASQRGAGAPLKGVDVKLG
jgi:hypothetical protein